MSKINSPYLVSELSELQVGNKLMVGLGNVVQRRWFPWWFPGPGHTTYCQCHVPAWRPLWIKNNISEHSTAWWYKSALGQVMAWCHQAPSHYLNQCWQICTMPYWYGITVWKAIWVFINHFPISGIISRYRELNSRYREIIPDIGKSFPDIGNSNSRYREISNYFLISGIQFPDIRK